MLKDIGLEFKRIPLDPKVADIKAISFTPEVVKGNRKSLVHPVSQFPEVSFKKSLGDNYENFIVTHAKSKVSLVLNQAEPVWLRYENEDDLIMYNTIEVAPYTSATVILEHLAKDSIHLGQMKVLVKEGASLNLIKYQGNHSKCSYVDETLVQVEDRASVKIIDIQMGSEKMIVNYDTNLLGYESSCDVHSLYLASDDEGIDLSFTATHIGKKTKSNIMGKGVLSGQARKVFRGTLNFERGSVKSVGKEEEVVLLLSEKVKSDSIPALMCSEDDVIGEHGASIGQLDENQLFYLMSRGLSEDEAKLLVISSSFRDVVENIEDEDFKSRTIDALDWRIKNAI